MRERERDLLLINLTLKAYLLEGVKPLATLCGKSGCDFLLPHNSFGTWGASSYSLGTKRATRATLSSPFPFSI